MVFPLEAGSPIPAEWFLFLKAQVYIADEQKKAAEKAVASFAEFVKNNQTPDALITYRELLKKAQGANGRAVNLSKLLLQVERVFNNPNNQPPLPNESDAPLESTQVVEMDLSELVGYFPT